MVPITMEITSPEVPDLTLIDLPGITEVAFGNQDEDIVDQVRIVRSMNSCYYFLLSFIVL